MKTDIEIAQEAELKPITEVAKSLDMTMDDLELYGKYKAKISDEYLKKIEKNENGKLILVTALFFQHLLDLKTRKNRLDALDPLSRHVLCELP